MQNPVEIDVIILSFAHSDQLLQMTGNAVQSLSESEDSSNIRFNIVVIESEKALKPFQYLNTTTIYPDVPFGYHRYMNIGIRATKAPYICICNNDLIFHQNWASEILKQMHRFPDLISASPISPNYHPNLGLSLQDDVLPGYRVGYEIAGWCLFYKRILTSYTGMLDENYEFSGADYDYSYTLWVNRLAHALITKSIVYHLTGQTIQTQTEEKRDKLTKDIVYHQKKWAPRINCKPLD